MMESNGPATPAPPRLPWAPADGPGTFGSLLNRLQPCEDVAETITRAIADDPPAVLGTGDAIRPGFHPELDQLREASRNAQGWVANLEEEERNRTGIPSLKVGYNKIFGYYLEVSNAHKDRIPANYIRRQTLVGAERYITPELKEAESLDPQRQGAPGGVGAERSSPEVLAAVSACAERLLAAAQALAHIDVFAGLAEVAVARNYVRPELEADGPITITQGRHPVVERSLRDEIFVPNDVHLDNGASQIIILTGPNMAGKSVYLKSIAQIILLAQIGAFVPADRARIGLVDRIFTRIGAQDDIATGQSTFMVEMVETANILNHATPRSLVILDEIGRGTSTYDGLAIARAVVEYIHNNPRLGATHAVRHALPRTDRPGARAAARAQLQRGRRRGRRGTGLPARRWCPAARTAPMASMSRACAGVPAASSSAPRTSCANWSRAGSKERRRAVMQDAPAAGQLSFLGAAARRPRRPPGPAARRARALPVDEMTPLEALGKLYELRKKARDAAPA